MFDLLIYLNSFQLMSIEERILLAKKKKGYSWDKLSEGLPITGEALRIAFKRGSVDDFYLDHLKKVLEIESENKLFKQEEETLSNTSNIAVNEPLGYIKNKNGLIYEELPDGRFWVEVPHVPYNAYASFIEVYGDEYAVKEHFGTKFYTVDHPGKGNYLSFRTRNDSMNGGGIFDTPSGADVLARELQKHHWKDGFRDSDYGWIIISHDGMFHKDIEGPDEQGYITCKSRNKSPEFSDFKMRLNDIHTIWKVTKRLF